MLHPLISAELVKSIQDERLAAAAHGHLAAATHGRKIGLLADSRAIREAEVVRFGLSYTREAGDRLAV